MTLEPVQSDALFATEIGGPMVFTFGKVLSIEKKKLTQAIHSNGGKVIEYSQRDKCTIVLTKRNKQSNEEIQFDLKYIQDCIRKKEILPLEIYRLDKKVHIGCCYSQPLGSNQCLYSQLIQQGKCKLHKRVSSEQNTEEVFENCDDVRTLQKLEFIENLIYVERKPQVKVELDMPDESMEEEQDSQSFDESQSLLRKN